MSRVCEKLDYPVQPGTGTRTLQDVMKLTFLRKDVMPGSGDNVLPETLSLYNIMYTAGSGQPSELQHHG